MAKMTETKMRSERRCGLKYWDRALNEHGKDKIIETTIGYVLNHRGVWGNEWSDAHWAIGNAVRSLLELKTDPPMSWNIHDVLTQDEIRDLAESLNFKTEYKPTWPRLP